MRSIERRFARFEEKRPALSSYMNFAAAIMGQGFSKEMIQRWFNVLVDKDDYKKADKQAILQHLYMISEPVDDGIQGKIAP